MKYAARAYTVHVTRLTLDRNATPLVRACRLCATCLQHRESSLSRASLEATS